MTHYLQSHEQTVRGTLVGTQTGMASGVHTLPVKFHRVLRAHNRLTFAANGLYGYLRSRAVHSTENPVFDLDRFWCKDALCIEAGSRFNVAVYFLFDCAEHTDECQEHLGSVLAVDADVFRFTPSDERPSGHSVAILFSHLSPLMGPMTFREVEQAVKHYLGWCSKLDCNEPCWKSAVRVTIELVPQFERVEWFKTREKGFSDSEMQGFCVGLGFPCTTPCNGEPEGEDSKIPRGVTPTSLL